MGSSPNEHDTRAYLLAFDSRNAHLSHARWGLPEQMHILATGSHLP